ncbi:Wzz/FepE/Etk N-terminal domain-containing protein [Candidatus Margulisiibacteriota bacterium]
MMEDEINLLEYWEKIVKRKWIVVLLVVIALFYAFFTNWRQPKLYSATATIMTVDTGGGGLSSALAGVPFLSGGKSGGAESKLIPILKSATVARRVAESIDLQDASSSLSLEKDLSDEKKLQEVASALRGMIKPKLDGGLLNVTVEWYDRKQAVILANSYVVQLGKFLNQRSLNVNFHVIDPADRVKRLIKNEIDIKIAAVVGLFLGVIAAILLDFLGHHPKAKKT